MTTPTWCALIRTPLMAEATKPAHVSEQQWKVGCHGDNSLMLGESASYVFASSGSRNCKLGEKGRERDLASGE